MTRRKRRSAIAGIAALLALAAYYFLAPEQAPGYRLCARVIDGDTIELAGGSGTGERVRLIGVDAPERSDPRPEVRRLAADASAFTRRLCEGRRVRLQYDGERQDRYSRTLAYVYLEDGTFVNAEIVRQGFGYAYTRFPFRYLEQFRAYEREARTASRGLWASAASADR